MNTLHTLLNAPTQQFLTKSTNPHLIDTQREHINTYLNTTPPPSIYGYTTLLGPRDHIAAHDDYQTRLLQGHLTGRQTTLNPRTHNLITRTKIHQLSHGGTGISTPTYTHLTDKTDTITTPQTGAWKDSYGAGDVIPTSWWIHTLYTDQEITHLAPGDLIALMNGNFYSTGYALATLEHTITELSLLIATLTPYVDPPLTPHTPLHKKITDNSTTQRRPVDVQHSVALRDMEPYLNAAEYAVQVTAQALEMRLGSPSGNPLFVFDGDKVTHYSQSSFMDYRLSAAVGVLCDAVKFVSAGVLSVLRKCFTDVESGVETNKLGEIVFDDMCGVTKDRFAIVEASGVEDVCDRTLQRLGVLEDVLVGASELRYLVGLLSDVDVSEIASGVEGLLWDVVFE